MFLLAAALLAGLGTAAALNRHHDRSASQRLTGPSPAPAGSWFDALAASRGIAGDAERTTCGLILTQRSLGITEPVLPCHAKVVIRFGNRTFLTEVIDNRLKASGRQFELTEALAQRMGLDGTQRIQWRFAARR